jgi:FtsP/CotA-like multicopper oxidase with cupredoxin domain
MNKIINVSGNKVSEKRGRELTDKVENLDFCQLASILPIVNSLFIITVRNPASSLGVAIALLTGSLLSISPAKAGVLTVPSGLNQPSPLSGAKPFSARVVLFEEFGLQDYKDSNGLPKEDLSKTTLPRPLDSTGNADCTGNVDNAGLDSLIKNKELYPLPGEFAHTEKDADGKFIYANPWSDDIKTCDPNTAALLSMPMDGRPGEDDFKHQRWNDFQPVKFFQAIQAGARTSGGARDKLQLHGYSQTVGKWSEFGPGGLNYNTVTSPYLPGGPLAGTLAGDKFAPVEVSATGYLPQFEGTTKGIDVQIHPLMPVQDKNSVWTFDGTIPPKLLMARYGETILFRHHNALPIDQATNNGFGTHTISTHEHNGHNPAESDGFAGAYFYPGQYYDYRWPMVLAGHDSINTLATDKRAAMPCTPGEVVDKVTCPAPGTIQVPGDYRETMSTHWFHDHMLDFTAQNVYKGNAAMMNYYSAIDRGNEEINDGVNLRLPSGTAKSWGNRDYDVNLVLADKAFDLFGQLYFNPLITDGFLGDVMTVNWVYKPYMDVRARKYRFRMLNGSVSRYMKIAVVDQNGAQIPFYQIANDGNIMQHAVAYPNTAAGQGLPTQSIAERYDIVVDFAPLYAKGVRKVYLVNLMEHATGAGPKVKPVTVAAAFKAFDGAKTTYNDNDLAIGKFMEFRLRPLPVGQVDNSLNPAEYTETVIDAKTKKTVPGKVLLPLPTFTKAELASAKHRTFIYGKKPDTVTDGVPWTIATDDGPGLTADIDRISAAPIKNSVEIWHLVNNAAGWAHPAHIHFEEGQIIKRDGLTPPPWERLGRKDMYRIGPEINSSGEIDIAIRVRDFTGTYVQHCHNTQHEDHAMLLRWDIENADHAKWVRTPYPEWSGVEYDAPGFGQTYKLPTADTGSSTTTQAKKLVIPATFGQRAADVPVTSVPNP